MAEQQSTNRETKINEKDIKEAHKLAERASRTVAEMFVAGRVDEAIKELSNALVEANKYK